MERTQESVLDAVFEGELDAETLGNDDEDVEMVDADGGDEAADAAGGGGSQQANPNRRAGNKKKKKKKKKKMRKNSGAAPNITDINRFVMDTCRRLKEKKSYLVWNAIGCLGVSAFSDLVKEVDAILRCGGQRTLDGSRFRSGGGILWNILKTREPKAYKEIMTKGREFEKQLYQPKKRHKTDSDEAVPQKTTAADEAARGGVVVNSSECMLLAQEFCEPSSNTERLSVKDRMRVPVSYDDLIEEGEIHE